MSRTLTPKRSGSTLLEIPWRIIRPMPGQPREHFDPAKLEQLARSIRTVGQRTPVQVVPLENDRRHQYELIDGQRRWHAVQMAGLEDLRCEVFDVGDPELRYVMSVVANLCRQGHEPLEMAAAFRRMQRTMTLAEIADAIGMSVAHVTHHLSLLKLAPEVQAAMSPALGKQRLPYSAALMLTSLPHQDQVTALAKIKSLKTSPMRAVKSVVGTLVAQVRPGARKQTAKDVFRVIRSRIDRMRMDLVAIPTETFAGTLKTRGEDDVRAVRAALEEAAEQIDRLLATSAV